MRLLENNSSQLMVEARVRPQRNQYSGCREQRSAGAYSFPERSVSSVNSLQPMSQSIVEELLERKCSGSGLENRPQGSLRWPRNAFYPQKSTLLRRLPRSLSRYKSLADWKPRSLFCFLFRASLSGGWFNRSSWGRNAKQLLRSTPAKQKQTPWPLVRKRTIPTERPPLATQSRRKYDGTGSKHILFGPLNNIFG
jgi:hypothetical protein